MKPYFKVLIPLPHSEQFIVAKNVKKKKKKVTEVSSNYENNTNDTVKKSRTLQKGKKRGDDDEVHCHDCRDDAVDVLIH